MVRRRQAKKEARMKKDRMGREAAGGPLVGGRVGNAERDVPLTAAVVIGYPRYLVLNLTPQASRWPVASRLTRVRIAYNLVYDVTLVSARQIGFRALLDCTATHW